MRIWLSHVTRLAINENGKSMRDMERKCPIANADNAFGKALCLRSIKAADTANGHPIAGFKP